MAITRQQKEKFAAELAIFLIDLKEDIQNGKYGSVFEDVLNRYVWMDGYRIDMMEVCSMCSYYADQPKDEIDMDDLMDCVRTEMIEDRPTSDYVREDYDIPEIVVGLEGFIWECMFYRDSEDKYKVVCDFDEVVTRNGMWYDVGSGNALLYERTND